MSPERHLSRLTWPEVQAAASHPGSTVVWPWGAVEQHGPHLPLGTDGLFAERVLDAALDQLAPERPVWRLPLQAIGFSPEHQAFPGTLSLPVHLLVELIGTVGRQLAACGFQRLVLLNGHGGQIGMLQTAARALRADVPRLGVLPCFLWSGPEGVAELIPAAERHQGLHAGLAETSLMLHLAPRQVGGERPRDGLLPTPPPQGWSLEEAAPTAWLMEDLSESGVVGDSQGSTAALGSQLFERLVAGWSRRFDSLLVSDWPPNGAAGGLPGRQND